MVDVPYRHTVAAVPMRLGFYGDGSSQSVFRDAQKHCHAHPNRKVVKTGVQNEYGVYNPAAVCFCRL
jgi:hypothetical protein